MVFARLSACVCLLAAVLAGPALAQTEFRLLVPDASAGLDELLRGAALTRGAAEAETSDAQEIFAAARTDYARLLGVLYDQGYYGGSISIRIDGREAATIAPMDAPDQIGQVEMRVDPGPQFHFSRAAVGPLAPKTALPPEFRLGAVARSGLISEAARDGVEAWRDGGHAKAKLAGQSIVADHRRQSLAAEVRLDPGPLSWFGTMTQSGNVRLRAKRLAEIAGYPSGKRFSPARLDEVRARLRRSGIFSSVALTEAEALRNGNLLDADLVVVEAKRRRLGFGAELSSSDGVTLSGYWLHRNLLGGGERLRLDAELGGLGGGTGGIDYSLGARLDRPATFSPDTSAFLETALRKENTDDYESRGFTFGLGLSHIFNERLTGEVAARYEWSQVRDDSGRSIFRQVSLPIALTWDNRDVPADASRGYFGTLEVMPFYGLGTTGSGARLQGDFRAYRAFGENGRFVLAGRAQIGGIFGATLLSTPRDYLFYSGGGGTVRGQPYESLGVNVLRAGAQRTGGTRFMGFSGELRAGVTEKIGLVAFYDTGFISADDFFGTGGRWHSGAGLGLRYKTPIGPIRLDIAAPVDGNTGDGAQIYLGIGQAF